MNDRPRAALITGASSGIGLSAAIALSRRGFRAFASMRDPRKVDALAREAQQAGVSIDVLRLDVTDEGSIREALDTIRERTGDAPDVLVNNAGAGIIGAFEEVSEAELRALFETNFFGLAAVARGVVPAMRARGSGRIINVGSIGGRLSMRGLGAYSASKYAVVALTDALRREMRPFGVHVSLIEPGGVRTELIGPNRPVSAAARDPRSPYHATTTQITRSMQLNYERVGAAPERVAEVIVRAATTRWPAPTYRVGLDAHALGLLTSILHGRAQDFVLEKVFDRIMSFGVG